MTRSKAVEVLRELRRLSTRRSPAPHIQATVEAIDVLIEDKVWTIMVKRPDEDTWQLGAVCASLAGAKDHVAYLTKSVGGFEYTILTRMILD